MRRIEGHPCDRSLDTPATARATREERSFALNIDIQFWGVTARLAGGDRRRISLPEAATVADAIALLRADAALAKELPRCAYAIGADLVPVNHSLSEGDELSVLPPVSGG